MGIDDLFHQIEADETQDALELAREGQVLLTPINYARARGIAPQRVYAAFRRGKLQRETCPCGRSVVDVEAADTLFGFKEVGDEV